MSRMSKFVSASTFEPWTSPHRGPCDRDGVRSAPFGYRRAGRRQCHRGPDPEGTRSGQEAADQGPLDRAADRDRSGGFADEEQIRPDHPWPHDALALNREREEIATIAKTKPNIDLEITFDYNSADISRSRCPRCRRLGRALTSPELKGSTFIVAGHTDAAGGETYNQDLSERRADSIKRYLVDKFGIVGADLVTVGYGKSKLKDPSQPLAEVNRRVQVVNTENKTTASK